MCPKVGKEVGGRTADKTDRAIEVQGLCKCYGETRALENVGFTVRRGEVLGYLGPNGAGKTTTVNILCGLLERDAGEVMIWGLDINRDHVPVKKRTGVSEERKPISSYYSVWCQEILIK